MQKLTLTYTESQQGSRLFFQVSEIVFSAQNGKLVQFIVVFN